MELIANTEAEIRFQRGFVAAMWQACSALEEFPPGTLHEASWSRKKKKELIHRIIQYRMRLALLSPKLEGASIANSQLLPLVVTNAFRNLHH
jgi:hypothetical protein